MQFRKVAMILFNVSERWSTSRKDRRAYCVYRLILVLNFSFKQECPEEISSGNNKILCVKCIRITEIFQRHVQVLWHAQTHIHTLAGARAQWRPRAFSLNVSVILNISIIFEDVKQRCCSETTQMMVFYCSISHSSRFQGYRCSFRELREFRFERTILKSKRFGRWNNDKTKWSFYFR